jgi:bifunctional non-homologous end joining protein LigD
MMPVRLFTRNGYDWSRRFPVIAEATACLKAGTFTIDGAAVMGGETYSYLTWKRAKPNT